MCQQNPRLHEGESEIDTHIGVNTSEKFTIRRVDIGNRDGPLLLRGTVSARPVKLSEVLDAIVLDDDVSSAIVLDNFVVSVLRTSTLDCRGSRTLLDCNGILIKKMYQLRFGESTEINEPRRRPRTRLSFIYERMCRTDEFPETYRWSKCKNLEGNQISLAQKTKATRADIPKQ